MKDIVYNFPTSVKIEKTQGKRPYGGMQGTDDLTLPVVSPESSSSLCKLVLNTGPSHCYQQAPFLLRKDLHSFEVSEDYVRTHAPKDSS